MRCTYLLCRVGGPVGARLQRHAAHAARRDAEHLAADGHAGARRNVLENRVAAISGHGQGEEARKPTAVIHAGRAGGASRHRPAGAGNTYNMHAPLHDPPHAHMPQHPHRGHGAAGCLAKRQVPDAPDAGTETLRAAKLNSRRPGKCSRGTLVATRSAGAGVAWVAPSRLSAAATSSMRAATERAISRKGGVLRSAVGSVFIFFLRHARLPRRLVGGMGP